MTGSDVQLPFTMTNGARVATMLATDSKVDSITYKIIAGNSNAAFSIHPETGVITLSDRDALALQYPSSFDMTIMAQDSGYGGLFPRKSTNAIVHVQLTEEVPFKWSGAGTNDHWSDSGNWAGLQPANSAGLRFAGTQRRTNLNDLLDLVGPVRMDGGGFQISGRRLTLRAGLVSSGDNPWNLDTRFSTAQGITNVSGNLTFGGSLDPGGNHLSITVLAPVQLNGPVIGEGQLIKSGPDTLILNSSSPFAGDIIVAAGNLVLWPAATVARVKQITVREKTTFDVSRTSGDFTLESDQTLTGHGIVLGNIRIAGTVTPGPSTGSLTFSNDVALAGRVVLKVSRSVSGPSSDRLLVSGKLNFGGLLIITNFGQDLAAGDSFKLFDAALFGGSFTTIEPLAPAAGLIWDPGQLSSHGILRVIAVPAEETKISFFSRGQDGLRLEIQSSSGTDYVLEQTASLMPPPIWSPVVTNIGTGEALIFPVQLQNEASEQFYRIKHH